MRASSQTNWLAACWGVCSIGRSIFRASLLTQKRPSSQLITIQIAISANELNRNADDSVACTEQLAVTNSQLNAMVANFKLK